jgi:hypothetical protein
LGCCSMQSCRYWPAFRRSVLLSSWGCPTFITLVMEVVSSSETPVNICQTTWHNIPEDSHLHTCHHENLKSHILLRYSYPQF